MEAEYIAGSHSGRELMFVWKLLIQRNWLSDCKPRQTFQRNDCTALISRVWHSNCLVNNLLLQGSGYNEEGKGNKSQKTVLLEIALAIT